MNDINFKTTLNKQISIFAYLKGFGILMSLYFIMGYSVFQIYKYISADMAIMECSFIPTEWIKIGNVYIPVLIAAILILWITSILTKKKYFKHSTVIGSIIIGTDTITTHNGTQEITHEISDLTNVKIYYNGYFGQSIIGRLNMGDNNFITFNQNQDAFIYKFDIESLEAMEKLKVILEEWYNKKNKFKEYTIGLRSFLLQRERDSYTIHMLKQKYDFEW